MDVLGNHQVVAKVECWGIDPAVEQPERMDEVGAVVRHGAAIRHVHGHAMAPPSPSGALPVVSGKGRHIAHQHGIQLTDVHAQLQCRGAHERIHGCRIALEQILEALALVVRHHRRMFLGSEHRVALVEEL